MRATVIHAVRDIRLDEVPDPTLLADTDAIVRVVAACVCGSDLWPYRGEHGDLEPERIGHEFVGHVEAVGSDVQTIAPGDFVIAPFTYQDNTCPLCALGVHTSCVNGGFWGAPDRQGLHTDGGQGEIVRVPLADGTLVKTPGEPDASLIPDLLTLSDVFPTGHHAAMVAGVTPGSNVAVVGDGAVGLSAVLAAKRLGAGAVIAMSKYPERQRIARDFGADHVIETRGKEGAGEVKEIFDGLGADFVLECVGTNASMKQASLSARPGGRIGFVGMPHEVTINPNVLFGLNLGVAGGVAPVRAYLDELLPEVWDGTLRPGAVFDRSYALDGVADAYRDMDERRTTKAFLDVAR